MSYLGSAMFTLSMAGALFFVYCVYYDQQRRSDPEYKKKVHERRKRDSLEKRDSVQTLLSSLHDQESISRYYQKESQLGNKLIARGEFGTGIEHLAHSLLVCRQPALMLQMMHLSLKEPLFCMLIERVQDLTKRAYGESRDKPKRAYSDMSITSAMSTFSEQHSKISTVPFYGYNEASVNYELE